MKNKQNKAKSAQKKEIAAKKLRWMWLLTALCIATLGIVWVSLEDEVLFRVQELNLFLYTPLFFKQSLVVSGGLLTYLGCYFQQYLYHPWLGMTMMCVMWLVIVLLERQTFHISDRWALITLVPIVMIALTCLDMGYWIYYIKLKGWFFDATIGTLFCLGFVYGYKKLPSRYFLRTVWMIISTLAGYIALGIYGLFAVLLMVIMAWRTTEYKQINKIVDTVAGVLSIILVPIILYYTLYYQTSLSMIYFTGLPVFAIAKTGYLYFIPYILLGLSLILMAVLGGKVGNTQPVRKRWAYVGANVLILAALVCALKIGWYRDLNYHTEIRMVHQCENLDWEGALRTMQDVTYKYESENEGKIYQPTRAIWNLKNLSLLRLGRLGDEMYHYRNGSAKVNAPFFVRMTQTGAKLLYLNCGLENYCYRWCNEDGVEYGWKVEYYKFMIKTAILNGEYEVAKKFIDILKETKYYKDFALKYESYLYHPEKVKQDKELSFALNFKDIPNELTSDQSLVEMFLMDFFSRTISQNPIHETLCIMSALQQKDIKTFWAQFGVYARQHQTGHMPTHIQEAAYLYGHLENNVDISQMPFDKSVVESYNEFMKAAQTECAGLTEKQMQPILLSRFGNTFYYDYFLQRDLETY